MRISAILFIVLAWFIQTTKGQTTGWQQKDFIITMWCPPPASDENFQILKRDGYNLTNISLGEDKRVTFNEFAKSLDIANRHGLKTLIVNQLLQPSMLDDSVKKMELDNLIDGIKRHPALEGYFLIDEPNASSFAGWGKLTKYIKEKDPDHLTYLNLFPNYAKQNDLDVFPAKKWISSKKMYTEYLKLYTEHVPVELFSYDHYNFFKNKKDGSQYFLNLSMIAAAAEKAKVPFINIVQACTILPYWRLPNEDELRWLAYTTMTYGAHGISWFLYWGPASYGGCYQDGKRMPIADHVARINQEIKALGPELMKLTSTRIYHSGHLPVGTNRIPKESTVKVSGGSFILGFFKENNLENAFMITNRDYKKTAIANITFETGNRKLLEYSIEKCCWDTVKNIQKGNILTLELRPGAGKLFKFGEIQ